MASSWKNIDGNRLKLSDSVDDKDGAGMPQATMAVKIAESTNKINGGNSAVPVGYDYGTMNFPTDFPSGYYYEEYYMKMPPNSASQIVLVWDSTANCLRTPNSNYNFCDTDTIDADLDLYVYDQYGNLIDYSISWDNNYEIVYLENNTNEAKQFKIKIKLWSYNNSFTYFSLAFSNTQIGLITPCAEPCPCSNLGACQGCSECICVNNFWECNYSLCPDYECNYDLNYNECMELSCDGVDNDCDGLIDNSWQVGDACDGPDSDFCKNGTYTCKTDKTGIECVNETITDIVEVCYDGIDNDCDGIIDEGIEEICDYIDNDCDWLIDEDVPHNNCGGCASLTLEGGQPCGFFGIGVCTGIDTTECMEQFYVGFVTGYVYELISGSLQPLLDAQISISGYPYVYNTDINGHFIAPAPNFGNQVFTISKSGYTFSQKIINVLSRATSSEDTFLLPLSPLQPQTPFDPNLPWTLNNEDGSFIITIPSGSLSDALNFSAVLFKNPDSLPKAPDGENYLAFGFHIEPFMSFSSPASVKIRNDVGFAPNFEIPIYIYNSQNHAWESYTTGTISSDGGYLELNIMETSVFLAALKASSQRTPINPTAVDLTLREREIVEENIDKSAISKRGASLRYVYNRRAMENIEWKLYNVSLVYDSLSANPYSYLSLGEFLLQNPDMELPVMMKYSWNIGSQSGQVYFDNTDPITGIALDGRSHFPLYIQPKGETLSGNYILPTGIYPYKLKFTNLFPCKYEGTNIKTPYPCGIHQEFLSYITVVNMIDSPYGNGWNVAGIKRIFNDEIGKNYMVLDGTRGIIPDSLVEIFAGSLQTPIPPSSLCDRQLASGCPMKITAISFSNQGNNTYLGISSNSNIINIMRVDEEGIAYTYYYNYLGENPINPSPTPNPPFSYLSDMEIDSNGNFYLAYPEGCVILKIENTNPPTYSFYAGVGSCGYNGDDILATEAKIGNIKAISFDYNEDLYIADTNNAMVRMVEKLSGKIFTIAGGGGIEGAFCDWTPAREAKLSPSLLDIKIASDGTIYLLEDIRLNVLKKIDGVWKIKTIGGEALGCTIPYILPLSVAISQDGEVYVWDRATFSILKLDNNGNFIKFLNKNELFNLNEAIRLKFDSKDNLYAVMRTEQSQIYTTLEIKNPSLEGEFILRKNPDSTFTIFYPDGVEENFSPFGLMINRIDKDGLITTYSYETYTKNLSDGNLITDFRISNIGWPDGNSTSFNYDTRDKIVSIIDGDGYVTDFLIDKNNDLVLINDWKGNFRINIYNEKHLLVATIDDYMKMTQYEYNEEGMVSEIYTNSASFLSKAPKETGDFINKISYIYKTISNPIGGYTAALKSMSSFMEKPCTNDSDCIDDSEWTKDVCVNSFCENYSSKTFIDPFIFSKFRSGCLFPDGCYPSDVFVFCDYNNFKSVCDDQDENTWDICIDNQCKNLLIPCVSDNCGCKKIVNGNDCKLYKIPQDELEKCKDRCLLYHSSADEFSCRDLCRDPLFFKYYGCVNPKCGEGYAPEPFDWDIIKCLNKKNNKNECKTEVMASKGVCQYEPSSSCCQYDSDCPSDFESCTVEKCINGKCVYEKLQNGTLCDDENACTSNDQCLNGECKGSEVICDDNNKCTNDYCDPQTGCHFIYMCNDHNDCTVDECDPQVGCSHTYKPDGTPCEDQNSCTLQSTCKSGICSQDVPLICFDDNVCTENTCDITTGCNFIPDSCTIAGEEFILAEGETPFVPNLGVDLSYMDRDNDGIIDKAEYELAEYFKPYFAFDEAEKGLAFWEPVVLYQLHTHPQFSLYCDNKENMYGCGIRIIYIALWDKDHGYDGCSYCGNDHIGDSAGVEEIIQTIDNGRTWKLTYVSVGRFYWSQTFATILLDAAKTMITPITMKDEHHPVVFLSAHKHHEYLETPSKGDYEDSPYSDWDCCDDVNGKGILKPAIIDSCTKYSNYAGNNVGEFSPEDPSKPKPQEYNTVNHNPVYFVNKLGNEDEGGQCPNMNNENAWSNYKFCGGLYEKLSPVCFWGYFWWDKNTEEKEYRNCMCKGSDPILNRLKKINEW